MHHLHTRIAVRIATVLVVGLVGVAWFLRRQLDQDVAQSLHVYAGGVNQMLVLSLREAMRQNNRDQLRGTIRDFGKLEWVRYVRVIDNQGRITFSGNVDDIGKRVSRASETCRACHRNTPVPARKTTILGSSERDTPILQAVEAVRAEADCLQCHEVPLGATLGIVLVELDMGPLSHDVRHRAQRSIWLLIGAAATLLILLVFVLRNIVVGRLLGLSEALASLRRGKYVAPEAASPVDEIDRLKETLAALGADLEAREFSTAMIRAAERELNGGRFGILLLDAQGTVLLANDRAQEELGGELRDLAGRAYPRMDLVRRDLWARAQAASLVLHPARRELRGARGAERVLMTLKENEGEVRGYLEVGRSALPEEETARDAERPPGRGSFPPDFMLTPYRPVTQEADWFFLALLLLSGLPPDACEPTEALDLDPTLAAGLRTVHRLVVLSEIVDRDVDVFDMAHLTRHVIEDIELAGRRPAHMQMILPSSLPMVGHKILMRQFATILVEMALSTTPKDLVVFQVPQQHEPKFFLGAWTSTAISGPPHRIRWQQCAEIAARFNGILEFSPHFDLRQIEGLRPGGWQGLGAGSLFLAEFPHTAG